MLIDIPFDIALEIFVELAGSSVGEALMLSTVSSEVKKYTGHQLYETVTLRSSRQVKAFLALLMKEEATGFSKGYVDPAPLVKNLCITHHVISTRLSVMDGGDPTTEIFKLCPNVQHIALQSTFLHSSLVPSHSVQSLRCQSLCVVGPTFPSDWEKHVLAIHSADLEGTAGKVASPASMLSHVTQLNVLDPLSSPHTSGPCLAHLPNLTHVALVQDQGKARTNFSELDALLRNPKLCMLVMSFDLRSCATVDVVLDELSDQAKKYDGRIFVLERVLVDSVGGWERTMRGGEDIWQRALREQEQRNVRRSSSHYHH